MKLNKLKNHNLNSDRLAPEVYSVNYYIVLPSPERYRDQWIHRWEDERMDGWTGMNGWTDEGLNVHMGDAILQTILRKNFHRRNKLPSKIPWFFYLQQQNPNFDTTTSVWVTQLYLSSVQKESCIIEWLYLHRYYQNSDIKKHKHQRDKWKVRNKERGSKGEKNKWSIWTMHIYSTCKLTSWKQQ